jgi:ceramide glucosyltransferase
MNHAAAALLALSLVGLVLLAIQLASLRRHRARRLSAPRGTPGISVLKPLCGLDEELWENLTNFAAIEWPACEVLLGVRSPADPAWKVALRAQAAWPHRFRAVVQSGEPGQNPKVNQLVTLARRARHDILVVSDSNVRVERGYLAEIAALLEDPEVGLVTHLVAGTGERTLGALFDHLHLTCAIAPGVVALKRVAGRDVVVGKSMALRRADLEALGGFEAAKDVLAEDYALGQCVVRGLGKRVAIGRQPIFQVGVERGVREVVGRYARWAVLHRTTTGRAVHLCQALLNPVLLGGVAVLLDPGAASALGLAAVCAAKMALDDACARLLRPGGFSIPQLLAVPLKDLAFGLPWARALVRRDVVWRGRRIEVGEGTRIEVGAAAGGLPALAAR